ncbi:MAG TPA: hypothetical protein VM616_06330 [Gammaproteobacteria bacterium]|nr:hypothetical protein [Gammaproteobacteria bacterium]
MNFAQLVREDCADGLPQLPRVEWHGSRQLDYLAAMCAETPDDNLLLERYLTEFLSRSARQVGGSICLAQTFAQRALDTSWPERINAPMKALAKLAQREPVRFVAGVDARTVAHALCADGRLVSWLLERKQGKRKPADAQQAYRRLSQRFHPDKGGDAEIMRDLNALRPQR